MGGKALNSKDNAVPRHLDMAMSENICLCFSALLYEYVTACIEIGLLNPSVK